MSLFYSAVYHIQTSTKSNSDNFQSGPHYTALQPSFGSINSSNEKSHLLQKNVAPVPSSSSKLNIILADYVNNRASTANIPGLNVVPSANFFSDAVDKIISGNIFDLRPPILDKLVSSRGVLKESFAYERFQYNLIVTCSSLGYSAPQLPFLFVVVSDETSGLRIPYGYLDDLINEWVRFLDESSRYGMDITWVDRQYSKQYDFGRRLQIRLDYWHQNPGADKFNNIKSEIQDVKKIMIDNIDKVIVRGEKIETLLDKTSELEGNAIQFRAKSVQLKKKQRRIHWKICVILIVILLILAYVGVAIGCKGPGLPRCVAKIKSLKKH